MDYILAIDQGTSGTKTVIFDKHGKPAAKGAVELPSLYPRPGFVEQDPEAIYRNVLASARICLDRFVSGGNDVGDIACCGISNQRETALLWDKAGTPLYNAVVWQCKRSVEICGRLKDEGADKEIGGRTGLIIDPYFSGTKVMWLNENDGTVRRLVREGRAYFGTVDTWLLYRLTGGAAYCTDHTNASRTLFFNLDALEWDEELLRIFGLTGLRLPEVRPGAGMFGQTDLDGLLDRPLPVTGMIGDSHAAAFGEECRTPGSAKVTLGTGSSILMNTGPDRKASQNGMVSTICWSVPGRLDYALEGIIVTCGATVKWLRDQLGLFTKAGDTRAMAESLDGNGGVYLVPAFSGLGAPHWKMDARASITGLTLGSTREHIVRAALESIPYQVKDVISAMETDAGLPLERLNADGGITGNGFVMQFMADLLRKPVVTVGLEEVSALGAAAMAGLGHGIYGSVDEIAYNGEGTGFSPGDGTTAATRGYAGWQELLGAYT